MYSIEGRTVATAATADHGVAELWNPHSTQRIKVVEFSIAAAAAPAAGACIKIRRSSARGTTATGTRTPGIQNHSEQGVAPPSGAVLDLGPFTAAQPTYDGDFIGPGWVLAAVAASGLVYRFPGGFVIKPGNGLVIVTGAAVAIPASDVSFVWLEDY